MSAEIDKDVALRKEVQSPRSQEQPAERTSATKVQDSMQKGDIVTATKRSCKTVYDKSQKLIGYDVTYRLNDKEGVVRTSFMPSDTLPVEKGKVVVTPPAGACVIGAC